MVPVLWCQYVTTGAVSRLNGACSLVLVSVEGGRSGH